MPENELSTTTPSSRRRMLSRYAKVVIPSLTLVALALVILVVHLSSHQLLEGSLAGGAPVGSFDEDVFISPLLMYFKLTADQVYSKILGSEPLHLRSSQTVVEVGSQNGEQALEAYHLGYRVIIYEPSPQSAARINNTLVAAKVNHSRCILRNKAASEHVGSAKFWSRGGTGDHVTISGKPNPGEEKFYIAKNTVFSKWKDMRVELEARAAKLVVVDTVPLDTDFPNPEVIFFLKVDTQGHDGHVFRGARKLFQEHRVLFAVFEITPSVMGVGATVDMMKNLHAYGYGIYKTEVHWSYSLDKFSYLWKINPNDPLSVAMDVNGSYLKMAAWTDVFVVCLPCFSGKRSNFFRRS